MKILKCERSYLLAGLAIIAGLLAGCSTHGKAGKTSYYFFPPPPDDPHIQYLTSFNSQKQFQGGERNSFVAFLTGQRSPNRSFGKPYGAVVAGHKLYVCDTDLGGLVVMDFAKRDFSMMAPDGEGAFKLPLNMTTDTNGTLYVADSGREQVVIYDNQQNYLGAIGKAGELKPRDVAVGNGRIYVADLKSHKILVYEKESRAKLFEIPRDQATNNEDVLLQMPTNLALDGRGRLYVADTGHFRVKIFDADGNYLRSVGEFGTGLGQFGRLKGVAVDRENRLYAVDAMHQVIQIFNDEGRMLTFFGNPVPGNEMDNLPAKVVVDYNNVDYFQKMAAPGFKIEYLVYVINQFGGHKVSVFGFGNKN